MEKTFSVCSSLIKTKKLLPEHSGEHSVYSRQEAKNDMDQKKNEGAKVVVVGAGGLGSTIGVSFARTGIGHIVICDGDRVELSNLNRQRFYPDQIGDYKAIALADNLERECTGDTTIEAYPLYFQNLLEKYPHVFLGADVILCLVDNEGTRYDVSRLGLELNIPVIFSALSRTTLNGYVFVQEKREKKLACYNCINPEGEDEEEDEAEDEEEQEEEQGGKCIDPAVIYTHQTAMGIATYATLSIIQGWDRDWNYYQFFLDSDSYARKVWPTEKSCEEYGSVL